jgi:2,4-diketo-3-deoxy-L-fuconate hydrolase
MRLFAYDHDGTRWMGVLVGEEVAPLASVVDFYADTEGHLAKAAEPGGGRRPVDDLVPVPPVPETARVLCVGVNYRAHATEAAVDVSAVPTVFARWPSTLVGDGTPVPLPAAEPRLDWEGELAAILKAPLRGATEAEAEAAILGYTCFSDLSTRGFQMATSQWTLGKNGDATGPIGPVIVTPDELGDPYALHLETRVNGKAMQSASTGDMIFRAPAVLAFASGAMTLRPGDVLATGTPEGVGFSRNPPIFLQPGDEVEVDIERIGVLRNRIG